MIKEAPRSVFSHAGETHRLRAVVYDQDGLIMDPLAPFHWQSSAPEVLSVDENGLLTAHRSGTATIRASLDRLGAEIGAGVAIVGAVVLEPSLDRTLALGETLELRAQVTDDRGEPMPNAKVRWSAGSHAVAIEEGVITAQATGSAQVFATAGEKSASLRITVK